MARNRDKKLQWVINSLRYNHFLDQLINLTVNRIKWDGLPDSADERFLEMGLLKNGHMLFFEDDVGLFRALNCTLSAPLDIHGIGKTRYVYTVSEERPTWRRNKKNSVVCFDNRLHTSIMPDLVQYANRLSNIMSAIDINMNQQKTPMILKGTEEQLLSLKNFYNNYDGNVPVMITTKELDLAEMCVYPTTAPFIAHDLYVMYLNTWNDIYTYLGIESSLIEKRERVQQSEIEANLACVEANRLTFMTERESAAKRANEMFGTELKPTFRQITIKDGLTDVPSNIYDNNIVPIYSQVHNNDGGMPG